MESDWPLRFSSCKVGILVFTFISNFFSSNVYVEASSLVSDGVHPSLLFSQESMEDDESLYAK